MEALREVADRRFDAARKDPRFRRMPKKDLRPEVDARFHRMFTDKENFERVDDLYHLPEVAAPSEEPRTDPPITEKNPYADEAQCLEDSDEDAERGTTTSSLLALQGYDWQHLSSQDLAELFLGLAREVGGAAVEVTVHRSAFGEERLREESTIGPQKALHAAFGDPQGKNPTALRKYELERLRYYFAVVRFDSIETATRVYDQFDGAEVGFSGCKLDLRFVPPDLVLPVAESRAVPTGEGKPLPDFETKAKSHSAVELTWEAPRPASTPALFTSPLESIGPQLLKEVVDSGEEEELESAAQVLRKKMLGGPSLFSDFDKKNRGSLRVEFQSGFDAEMPRGQSKRKSRKEFLRRAKEKASTKKARKEQEDELGLLVDQPQAVLRRANEEDSRFAKLRTDSTFAVDPTHPRFTTRERIAEIKKKKIKHWKDS